MNTKYFIGLGIAAIAGLSSCIHSTVDDECFPNENADPVALAAKLADKFTYDNGANHSNKIKVINNSGLDCQLDYMVGKVMLGCGLDNSVEVVVPFAGDLTFTATVIDNGQLVNVPFTVNVNDMDTDLDPLFVALTDGSAAGKTWQWWADENPDGSYSYIDGSWGCVGGGGYGWSATGPNWVCYGIGQVDEWTGQTVTMDEWVKFDCDGGPNVTVHYSDGTEATGTYALTAGTSAAKAALGWIGTIKIDGVLLPHQVNGSQYSWYLEVPPAAFDVAMLDDEHLIIIAPGNTTSVLCDPNWASASTHWTFKVKK